MPAALTVIYPDGGIEHRLTERELKVGDIFARNGRTWLVAQVSEEPDGALTIRVRGEGEPENASRRLGRAV